MNNVYLEVAKLIAKKSKDKETKIGACIVDSRGAIVSTGYNGPPRSADDDKVPLTRPDKYMWMIHAETNAILFALAARSEYMLSGCSLYVSGVVCSKCMLLAAHVGITEINCLDRSPVMCDEEDLRKVTTIGDLCQVAVHLYTDTGEHVRTLGQQFTPVRLNVRPLYLMPSAQEPSAQEPSAQAPSAQEHTASPVICIHGYSAHLCRQCAFDRQVRQEPRQDQAQVCQD